MFSKTQFLQRHEDEIWRELVASGLAASALPLDRLLGDYYRRRRYLGAKDRRLLSARIYARVRAMPWPAWLLPYYKPVYDQEAPLAIRANTLKIGRETLKQRLEAHGIAARATTLSRDGLLLDKRYPLHTLDLFKQGYFEVQDEGSQLVSELLAPRPGCCVLDACAGAGGKTLHLAALMHNQGKIAVTDADPRKLIELEKRAKKAGVSIVEIDRGESAHFDAILIDAPCTSVGTMRRNPDLRLRVSEDSIGRATRDQAQLLAHYAPAVKPGGIMVYATCSFLPAENEDIIRAFLERFPSYHIDHVLCVDPEVYSGDGFFAARLQFKGTVITEHSA